MESASQSHIAANTLGALAKTSTQGTLRSTIVQVIQKEPITSPEPPLDITISQKTPISKYGKPTFILTEEEMQQSLDHCKWYLVLKFNNTRPKPEDIRRVILRMWGLSSSVTIGALNTKDILLKIQNEEDHIKVLSRDFTWLLNEHFRIVKWSSSLREQKENPVVLRWIRLPSLPANLFAPSCLEGIGNSISRYICSDARTLDKSNPSYARMCVELDLSKALPSEVWIGTSMEAGYWQKIVIEGRTEFCLKCSKHGHLQMACRRVLSNPEPVQVNVEELNRKYCNFCELNNHNFDECRKIQQRDRLKKGEKPTCTHCNTFTHTTAKCRFLKTATNATEAQVTNIEVATARKILEKQNQSSTVLPVTDVEKDFDTHLAAVLDREHPSSSNPFVNLTVLENGISVEEWIAEQQVSMPTLQTPPCSPKKTLNSFKKLKSLNGMDSLENAEGSWSKSIKQMLGIGNSHNLGGEVQVPNA